MAASNVAHKINAQKRTSDVLMSENVDFAGLMLSEPVQRGLLSSGFEKPSPIQLKAIPLGRCGLDLIVQAKSGTGKTCVFAVVALESLQLGSSALQVLVLAPTREIAVQIQDVMKNIGVCLPRLACHTFIGGLPVKEDIQKLKRCHIAVGSPGRVKQLIENGILTTDSIRLFILDEADKLLEESFQEQINWIYSCLPENKQILALSATYPEYLAQHLTAYMRNPTFIRLNISDPALLGIKQYYKIVQHHPLPNKQLEVKTGTVIDILSNITFKQCLIFSNFQTRAQNLCSELLSRGWPTTCIAGSLDQKDRLEAMNQLKTYKCRVLISTDLTSRGIDADKVDLVINLDVPYDHETYLHRIGRAGRFGSFGAAISIVSEGKEESELHAVEKKCKTKISALPVPIPNNLVKIEIDFNLDDIISTEQLITVEQPQIPSSGLNQIGLQTEESCRNLTRPHNITYNKHTTIPNTMEPLTEHSEKSEISNFGSEVDVDANMTPSKQQFVFLDEQKSRMSCNLSNCSNSTQENLDSLSSPIVDIKDFSASSVSFQKTKNSQYVRPKQQCQELKSNFIKRDQLSATLEPSEAVQDMQLSATLEPSEAVKDMQLSATLEPSEAVKDMQLSATFEPNEAVKDMQLSATFEPSEAVQDMQLSATSEPSEAVKDMQFSATSEPSEAVQNLHEAAIDSAKLLVQSESTDLKQNGDLLKCCEEDMTSSNIKLETCEISEENRSKSNKNGLNVVHLDSINNNNITGINTAMINPDIQASKPVTAMINTDIQASKPVTAMINTDIQASKPVTAMINTDIQVSKPVESVLDVKQDKLNIEILDLINNNNISDNGRVVVEMSESVFDKREQEGEKCLSLLSSTSENMFGTRETVTCENISSTCENLMSDTRENFSAEETIKQCNEEKHSSELRYSESFDLSEGQGQSLTLEDVKSEPMRFCDSEDSTIEQHKLHRAGRKGLNYEQALTSYKLYMEAECSGQIDYFSQIKQDIHETLKKQPDLQNDTQLLTNIDDIYSRVLEKSNIALESKEQQTDESHGNEVINEHTSDVGSLTEPLNMEPNIIKLYRKEGTKTTSVIPATVIIEEQFKTDTSCFVSMHGKKSVESYPPLQKGPSKAEVFISNQNGVASLSDVNRLPPLTNSQCRVISAESDSEFAETDGSSSFDSNSDCDTDFQDDHPKGAACHSVKKSHLKSHKLTDLTRNGAFHYQWNSNSKKRSDQREGYVERCESNRGFQENYRQKCDKHGKIFKKQTSKNGRGGQETDDKHLSRRVDDKDASAIYNDGYIPFNQELYHSHYNQKHYQDYWHWYQDWYQWYLKNSCFPSYLYDYKNLLPNSGFMHPSDHLNDSYHGGQHYCHCQPKAKKRHVSQKESSKKQTSFAEFIKQYTRQMSK